MKWPYSKERTLTVTGIIAATIIGSTMLQVSIFPWIFQERIAEVSYKDLLNSTINILLGCATAIIAIIMAYTIEETKKKKEEK